MKRTNKRNTADDRCPLDPPSRPTKRRRSRPRPDSGAALKSFRPDDFMAAGYDAVEGLMRELASGAAPESAYNAAVRIAETFRLAWLLDEPHMADEIARRDR